MPAWLTHQVEIQVAYWEGQNSTFLDLCSIPLEIKAVT